MNADKCVIDLETNTVRTDVDLTKFLYIEWNSEQTYNGGGLRHIIWSITNLLAYYIINERQHRTIIFSDQWRPDFRLHSPKSQKTIVDIREYYELNSLIGTKLGQPIQSYFDHNGIFKNTFSTNEVVGIASRPGKKGFGLTKVRENNKNIIEVEQLNEHQLLKYNYNFWCGSFHDGRTPFIENHLKEHEININIWGWFKINMNLQNKARNIVNHIKQYSKNKDALHYVMHLRRGDMLLLDEDIAGSSEIPFVVNQLETNFAEGSSIYIMTNGTVEYATELKQKLQNKFTVFIKQDFTELDQLGDEDNFALYLVENEMCRSSGRITNRDYGVHNNRTFYLLYSYTQMPREVLITKNEDLLIKVTNEGKRYTVRTEIPLTLAFGSNDKFVFKHNCQSGQTMFFSKDFFGEDPDPDNLKFGYIKIGNKKNLIKIGEENSTYNSSDFYVALYGANNTFYCKSNLTGAIKFDNNTFGDPLPGVKKEAYVLERIT